MKTTLSLLLLLALALPTKSQDIPYFNHYFRYAYLYNPAFLNQYESTELNLIYRKQWVGIDGAPSFAHAGLQLPISKKLALGLNLSNLDQGLLMTSTALGSAAYTISLDNTKTFSFGLSIGAGRTALDASQITDFSDPAIAGSLDKSFYVEGQAGINLVINRLSIAVALPSLFERNILSMEDFQEVSLSPLNRTYSSVSYRFDLSPQFSFEPMGAYQTDDVLEDQWQAFGTFYYTNLLWAGGSYSDTYGASAYAGLRVNDFIKVGYSFDFGNGSLSGYNSHEFLLTISFGGKKFERRPTYVAEEIDDLPDQQLADIETESEEPELDETMDQVEEATITEPISDDLPAEPDEISEQVEASEPISQDSIDQALIEMENELYETMKENIPEEDLDPETEEHSTMEPGHYVVVGAFTVEANASKFAEQVTESGFEGHKSYREYNGLYYVYLLHSVNREEAVQLRDHIRKSSILTFNQAWILSIE